MVSSRTITHNIEVLVKAPHEKLQDLGDDAQRLFLQKAVSTFGQPSLPCICKTKEKRRLKIDFGNIAPNADSIYIFYGSFGDVLSFWATMQWVSWRYSSYHDHKPKPNTCCDSCKTLENSKHSIEQCKKIGLLRHADRTSSTETENLCYVWFLALRNTTFIKISSPAKGAIEQSRPTVVRLDAPPLSHSASCYEKKCVAQSAYNVRPRLTGMPSSPLVKPAFVSPPHMSI